MNSAWARRSPSPPNAATASKRCSKSRWLIARALTATTLTVMMLTVMPRRSSS